MIKIQNIIEEILMEDLEAYFALTEGYMNMTNYAHRVKQQVEGLSKKQVTITSMVVSLSHLKKELKKTKPLIHDVKIANIATKLPLSEISFDNSNKLLQELQLLQKNMSVSQEDFFTATIGTKEVDIICSANFENKVLKFFSTKPKIINRNLAAVGISFGPEVFGKPNVFFSLLSVTARARINIEELVSTPTELIFIIQEKDFGRTVALFSELHRKTNQ